MRRINHADWKAEAIKLYGEDSSQWEFRCPVCGHVTKVKDWQDAGAPEGQVAFSCVGRHIDGARGAFDGTGPGPCNYAGGGLFQMNPVTVVQEDGHETRAFEFAANPKHEGEAKK